MITLRHAPEVRNVWRAAIAGHQAGYFALPDTWVELNAVHELADLELGQLRDIDAEHRQAVQYLADTIRDALSARAPLPSGETGSSSPTSPYRHARRSESASKAQCMTSRWNSPD